MSGSERDEQQKGSEPKQVPKQVHECSVKEVWDVLSQKEQAALIDVRTRAEWSYVGCVDLSDVRKRPFLVEWLTFPANEINVRFVDQLQTELERFGLSKDADLFFLCRSGVRSLAAAKAMAAAGYQNCINIRHGFEGPLDAAQHRGLISGWKAEGLPWSQM